MSDIKQVIVIRTHYPNGKGGFFKPRIGKLIAQGAHASMAVFFKRGSVGAIWRQGDHGLLFEEEVLEMENVPRPAIFDPGDPALLVLLTSSMKEWVEGRFTKVVVGCNSESELRTLYENAETAYLPCALIEDSGLTEFKNVPTITALAIGPEEAERIDPITQHLVLL